METPHKVRYENWHFRQLQQYSKKHGSRSSVWTLRCLGSDVFPLFAIFSPISSILRPETLSVSRSAISKPSLTSPPKTYTQVTEPTTPRSEILLCEKLQTAEKKRIKSEAANRITPTVTRTSRCVFAYEKVTRYMSTLGYMAQYINKSLFPQVASAYSGSPKETAKSTHFSV
jgi:hypothetical protein